MAGGIYLNKLGNKTCSQTCAETEREGEGRGSGHPPPLKKHKNIGFLSKTGPDRTPEKITKLPSQHSKLFHHRPANETPLNGVLLAGR